MKTKTIPLKKIRLDGNTQPRVELDRSLVLEYARLYESGVELPPIEVTFDGADYWLTDGFHRRWGAEKAGRDSLKCRITFGTLDDARWSSYAANKGHGLRRTNEDKKKAVIAALKHPNGAQRSDRSIAEHVGVSHPMVIKYRNEISATGKDYQSNERAGRDGRTINTANIGKGNGKPEPPAIAGQAAPDETEEVEELPAVEESPPEPPKPTPQKPSTPFQHMVAWWQKANATERRAFVEWAQEQIKDS